MAEAHEKNHDYHIIDPSPWPLFGSIGALLMAIGGTRAGTWILAKWNDTDFQKVSQVIILTIATACLVHGILLLWPSLTA